MVEKTTNQDGSQVQHEMNSSLTLIIRSGLIIGVCSVLWSGTFFVTVKLVDERSGFWDARKLNKCSLCGLECSEMWVVELGMQGQQGLRTILSKPSGLSILKGSEPGILCVGLLGFWTLYLIYDSEPVMTFWKLDLSRSLSETAGRWGGAQWLLLYFSVKERMIMQGSGDQPSGHESQIKRKNVCGPHCK